MLKFSDDSLRLILNCLPVCEAHCNDEYHWQRVQDIRHAIRQELGEEWPTERRPEQPIMPTRHLF